MPGTDIDHLEEGRAPQAFVVEDDPLTRKVICAHLERLGFAPVEFGPSLEEIETSVAGAGLDDVLVVDIILGPDLDGFDVIRMLGRIGFKGRVLVVSGVSPDYVETLGALATAMNLRVAGALEKPLRPADLERCLRT